MWFKMECVDVQKMRNILEPNLQVLTRVWLRSSCWSRQVVDNTSSIHGLFFPLNESFCASNKLFIELVPFLELKHVDVDVMITSLDECRDIRWRCFKDSSSSTIESPSSKRFPQIRLLEFRDVSSQVHAWRRFHWESRRVDWRRNQFMDVIEGAAPSFQSLIQCSLLTERRFSLRIKAKIPSNISSSVVDKAIIELRWRSEEVLKRSCILWFGSRSWNRIRLFHDCSWVDRMTRFCETSLRKGKNQWNKIRSYLKSAFIVIFIDK